MNGETSALLELAQSQLRAARQAALAAAACAESGIALLSAALGESKDGDGNGVTKEIPRFMRKAVAGGGADHNERGE